MSSIKNYDLFNLIYENLYINKELLQHKGLLQHLYYKYIDLLMDHSYMTNSRSTRYYGTFTHIRSFIFKLFNENNLITKDVNLLLTKLLKLDKEVDISSQNTLQNLILIYSKNIDSNRILSEEQKKILRKLNEDIYKLNFSKYNKTETIKLFTKVKDMIRKNKEEDMIRKNKKPYTYLTITEILISKKEDEQYKEIFEILSNMEEKYYDIFYGNIT